MLAILDYGVGNLFSLSSSLTVLNVPHKITKYEEDLRNATHIILPGVGAFGDAMQKLQQTGLIPCLQAQVAQKKPLLGICLGMQMLFESSCEYGTHQGLGFLKGEIGSLREDLQSEYKVPHIGWNQLCIRKQNNALMVNTSQRDYVYFVHSFYAKNCEDSLVATAEYGVQVPAVVAKENVYGCQFHPEKSGKAGLRILKAFTGG